MRLRAATAEDIGAIRAIYAPAVLGGFASFEETPPSVEEMRGRFDEVAAKGLPYVVAECGGTLAGYGYCTLYRTRSAYRFALEDSVYVHPHMQGRGIGAALLEALIGRSEALGYRQLIAVIGDSGNAASIGLHSRLGFLRVGTLRSSGYKLGRWVDSVLMQRPLGAGDGRAPEELRP